jgi:hypothetical protein
MINLAILARYNFEESMSNTLGICSMKTVYSFAGLNTESLKMNFVEYLKTQLKCWLCKQGCHCNGINGTPQGL